MHFGVAYYPEHWPEDRWAIDARMMQKAGVNAVRMGEFAWSAIEPREGEYRFDWLDHSITLLAEHGVQTVLCTMSRTPPPWVFRKYPGVLNVDAEGARTSPGRRYTVALAHPEFRELSERIDRAVIERYAGNDAVTAWQIDNEIGQGTDCYCDHCREAFQQYLRDKYESVENLNESWGPHVWSLAFGDFDEVHVPPPWGGNPQLVLEYRRFLSRLNEDFARWRYDLLKQRCPDKWVTTNFQSHHIEHTDYFRLGAATDVYGTNYYPPRFKEFALDYYRGARGRLVVLEQCTRLDLSRPAIAPGEMRLWAYQALAHGACGVHFFRWRSGRWGQEMHADGLLGHDGGENRRYRELCRMGDEMQTLAPLLDRTRPCADAAIVMSYESRWALKAGLRKDALACQLEAENYHEALMDRNVTTDGMDPREDLTPYKLVIAPRLYCVDDAVAANLRRYVEGGGVLCLTPCSGVVDEYNKAFETRAPGPLADLAGVEIEERGALPEPIALRRHTGLPEDAVGYGRLIAEEVHPASAQVLATFDEGWRRDLPAVTVNRFGRGQVVYIATGLGEADLAGFMAWLCDLAGVTGLCETPEGVRAYERRGGGIRLRLLLNSSDEEQAAKLEEGWTDALTHEPCSHVVIFPRDLRVLIRK
jgi:beta-galactosidase